ncbi:hypothetical protein KI387_042354, partial [Taxus chinensis]
LFGTESSDPPEMGFLVPYPADDMWRNLIGFRLFSAIRVPCVPLSQLSQYEISLFQVNRPVHVLRALTAQMSQCESSLFRPNRPVRILRVPLSHLLPDCLGQILPIRPVRPVRVSHVPLSCLLL